MDVIFVFDQTNSISETELDGLKALVNDFANKVPFGGDNYRIGVLSWNANVEVNIRLLDHILPGDLSNFEAAVNDITSNTASSINIGQAIMTVREHFREGFGARSYALHVGIFMADTGVNFGDEITLARDENIILIGIALRAPGNVPALLQTFLDTIANGISNRSIISLPTSLVSNGVSDTLIAEIQTCSELFNTDKLIFCVCVCVCVKISMHTHTTRLSIITPSELNFSNYY